MKEGEGELTAAEERLETDEEERRHDAGWAEESRTNEERRDGEEFNPEEAEEDEEEEEGGGQEGGWGRGRMAARVGFAETRALHVLRSLKKHFTGENSLFS